VLPGCSLAQLVGADPLVGSGGTDVLPPLVAPGAVVVTEAVPVVVRAPVVGCEGRGVDVRADVVGVVVLVGGGLVELAGAWCTG
jgi:hypothetical protein